VDIALTGAFLGRARPATRVAGLAYRSSLAICGIGSPETVRTGGMAGYFVANYTITNQSGYKAKGHAPIWFSGEGW
jgi:hypothetical protein